MEKVNKKNFVCTNVGAHRRMPKFAQEAAFILLFLNSRCLTFQSLWLLICTGAKKSSK